MGREPFIKLIDTRKGTYFYDCGKNEVVPISKKLYKNLKNNINYIDEEVISLKKNGYLTYKRFEEIIHPNTNTLKYMYKNLCTRIILQITQQCNLECLYCPYSAGAVNNGYVNRIHENKVMSLEIAKKSVDFLINHSRNSERIMITFYGGEPLLHFDLIHSTMEYAKERAKGKEIRFGITTNGTMLNEKVIKYFIDNKVEMSISIDGPSEIHNSNRKIHGKNIGSYEKVIDNLIKIIKIDKNYLKNITISSVIDPKLDFKKIAKFFNEEKYIKDLNLVSTIINENYKLTPLEESDDFISDYRYERFKLLLAAVGRIDKKYAPRVLFSSMDLIKGNIAGKLQIKTNEMPKKISCGAQCIPGLARTLVDVNGNFYICEKVNEISKATKMGDINTGVNLDVAKKILNVAKITEDKCKNCWAIRFCKSCAISCDDGKKLSRKLRLSKCSDSLSATEHYLKEYLLLEEVRNGEI